MNLRDVPEPVYVALVEAASARRQSLNAYVVDRLSEIAATAHIAGHLASYHPPATGLTLEDASAAVREVREGS